MRYHLGLASLLLLVPSFVRGAEDVPEQLLPATTQIYLRWDGIDAHKAAYNKTSLGQMMKGDTGSFITGLFDKLQTSAGALLTVESLRRGEDPKTLKKLQADAKAAATLFPLIGKNGFLLAGELRQLEQPQGQIILILPGMGANPEPLFGALRLAIGLGKGEIKDGTIVLENLPADAEVTVDGETATLKWGDGKMTEVHVSPGKKHRIQVRKDGFKVFGDEVAVDVGGRKPVLVRLESIDPSRPPDAAWLKEVAALPVHKQADAVAAKLKELNPAFDGKIEYNLEGGQIVSLEFAIDSVKDISPVQALPGLRKLSCRGSWFRKGQLADLTPLKGMKLTG